jgi:hypothetical protein
MALKLVGIVDFTGQTHCLEHASTVSSYLQEIYSIDPARECWCGKRVGGRKRSTPSIAMQYRKMNDGVKGKRDVAGIIPSSRSRRVI